MEENQRQDRYCGICGAPAGEGQRFCRQCGFEFPIEEFEEERLLRAAIPEEKGTSCFAAIFKPFIAVGIFLAIAAGLTEISRLGRWRASSYLAREKACYANMRVLLGAIEMYNMDNPVMINSIDEATEDRLVAKQYLKCRLNRNDARCRYTSTGDLMKDGKITCDIHGTVE